MSALPSTAVRRRSLLAFPLAVLLAAAAAVPVSATFWSQVPAHLLKSACVGRDSNGNPTITWRGGHVGDDYGKFWNPANYAPHGKMYFCYYVYRLGDKTADGDVYAVDLRSVWNESGVWDSESAIGAQYVSSNTATKDSIWDSTPTFTSNNSCTTPVTIRLSASIFSVSTQYSVCSGETITVTRGSKVATWNIPRAAKVRSVETSYYQKVAHNARPTFTIWFEVPYYNYKTTYDAYGDPWWSVTSRAWKSYIYNVTV